MSQQSIEPPSKQKIASAIQKGPYNQPVPEHSDEGGSQSENFNIYDDPAAGRARIRRTRWSSRRRASTRLSVNSRSLPSWPVTTRWPASETSPRPSTSLPCSPQNALWPIRTRRSFSISPARPRVRSSRPKGAGPRLNLKPSRASRKWAAFSASEGKLLHRPPAALPAPQLS